MPAQREPLQRVQQLIAGSREDRDASRLPFEEGEHAVPVNQGGRCYGIGLSVEAQPNTGAPIASAKCDRTRPGVLTDDLSDRKEILTVSTRIQYKLT